MLSRTIDVDGVGLHVGVSGDGPDVVLLSGGPGCVQYLDRDELAPKGFRAWFPEPRGVGRSGGDAHSMERAVADLEAVREAAGVERWIVVGHSWGSDLAVRYAVDHPEVVVGVVGIAGHGLHSDRSWSAAYEAGLMTQPAVDIDWSPQVHAALKRSFTEWIHSPRLWRELADCPVPMHFIAPGDDHRPSWPLQQLAALVPEGRFETVSGVPHDFWLTDPQIWSNTVTVGCQALSSRAYQ